MGLYVKHRGRNSFFVLLFLGFIIYGLVSSRWDASYSTNWNNLGKSRSFLTSGYVVPHLKTTGDVNDDQYPDEIIYDGVEKSIWFQDIAGWTFDSDISLLNYAANLVFSTSQINSYGRSSMGLHTINGKAEVPEFLWSKTFTDRDIMYAEMIRDVTGDEIQDVLVSYGFTRPFPTEQTLLSIYPGGYDYYTLLYWYFLNNPYEFQSCFIVDNSSTQLVVTPNYVNYELWIFNGNNGSLVNREQPEGEFQLNRCVLDVCSLNNTRMVMEPYNPDIVLVTSNYSAPRYYSPFYYKNYELGHENVNMTNWLQYIQFSSGQSFFNTEEMNFDFRVHGLHVNPFKQIWSSSYSEIIPENKAMLRVKDIGIDQIPGAPSNLANAILNSTLRLARTIDVKPFGTHFILEYTTSDGSTDETDEFFILPGLIPATVFGVYEGETGNRLWYGNVSYQWLSKNSDLDDDGFGQINSVYSVDNSQELTVAYHNPSNGFIISKAILTDNSSRLINYDNLDAMWCTISEDDKIGNDGVYEVLMVGLNKSHYDAFNNPEHYMQPDPVQVARLSLNFSSQIHMIISLVSDFHLNINNYTSRIELMETGQDFDGDGWSEYFFFAHDGMAKRTTDISYKNNPSSLFEAILISGRGVQLYQRNIFAFFSTNMELVGMISNGYDLRVGNEMIYFFTDPVNSERISCISTTWNSYIYVQDINTFKPNVEFMEFFVGADILLIGLSFGALVCVIGIATGIGKKEKRRKTKDPAQETEANKIQSQIDELIDSKMMKSAGNVWYYVMFFIVFSIVMFFTRAIKLIIGYTDVVISPEGQLIWFLIMYPAIFGLLVLIPELYSSTAPFFAEKVFINAQRAVFSYFQKTQRKDYKVIVIHMEERRYVSTITRISRLLLPLLISFTIGTAIYQGLGPDGSLYSLLEPLGWIDHALTNPDALGIVNPEMVDARDLWVEIGSFARYCVVPMIITYIGTTVLIPGAWLLDDAGVCFYQKALKYREVSDVDSVSKWILSVISGLFGVTAIISFFSLFSPMLSQIDTLIDTLGFISGVDPLLGVVVLIVALIIFPIVSGILLMYAAMYMMEKNYVKNVRKIYYRMEKNGIDATPLEMSYILAGRQDRWFEQGQLGALRSDEKVKEKDIKKERAAPTEKNE